MPFPTRHTGFVLSAGRTGSVFLARALDERFADVCCVHEPPPARRELMLGNARNELGSAGGFVKRMFLRARRRRLERLPPEQKYIEINPMLCPITDLLPLLPKPLRVVQMVRDPRSWTRSILAFKASGIRRHVIDFVPFATPYPTPRPVGWDRLGPAGRALWRWRYCNDRIRDLRAHCELYTLVRYEDLFSSETDVRENSLRRMLKTLEIDPGDDLSWFDVGRRINTAPSSSPGDAPNEESVVSICGPLLDEYGYSKTSAVTT